MRVLAVVAVVLSPSVKFALFRLSFDAFLAARLLVLVVSLVLLFDDDGEADILNE